MTDTQLANIKKVWAKKTAKDVTPGIKSMLDKMDMPTKVAVKHAGINILSKIVLKDEVNLSVDVSETYTVVITKKDGSKMELGKYNTPAEAQRYVDQYGAGAKIKKEELQGQKEKNKEDIDEGKMSDIDAMQKDGASANDIAKALKISVATVKDILGEEKDLDEATFDEACWDGYKKVGMKNKGGRQVPNCVPDKGGNIPKEKKQEDKQQNKEDLEESFSPAMLQKLKTEFGPLKGKTITAARAKQLMNILDKLKDKDLETLKGAGIPFVSGGAMSKLSVRKMKFKVTTITPFGEETIEESYTVKYVDPLNKKNLRMKHADEKDAQDMMDRLKKAGVKDIKVVKEEDAYDKDDEKPKKPKSKPKKEEVKEGSSAFSPTKKFSDQEIKQAYGVANDPRYKGGNYSGAVTAIEKIAKGLSSYPAVQNVLKRTNEDTQSGAKALMDRIIKKKFTEAKWEIEGTLSYKGIGSYDNFHMVIDAANKKAAEDKAYEELDKARARKKIGPGGGGRVEDADVQEVNQTNDKLQAPTTFKGGN